MRKVVVVHQMTDENEWSFYGVYADLDTAYRLLRKDYETLASEGEDPYGDFDVFCEDLEIDEMPLLGENQ